jgi:hypothetical protein
MWRVKGRKLIIARTMLGSDEGYFDVSADARKGLIRGGRCEVKEVVFGFEGTNFPKPTL